MSHDLKISDALANAALDAITAALGSGCHLKFYSLGSGVPVSLATAITDQVLLATLAFSASAFGAAAAALAALNTVTGDPSIDATNAAAFFRVLDGSNVVQIQGLCGTSVSDANLNTLSFVATQTADITAGSLSLG